MEIDASTAYTGKSDDTDPLVDRPVVKGARGSPRPPRRLAPATAMVPASPWQNSAPLPVRSADFGRPRYARVNATWMGPLVDTTVALVA